MEADYVLIYASLIIILGLLVSSFHLDMGSDVTELLVAIAEASQRPGTALKVRLLLGEGASIACNENKITVRKAVISQGVIRLYRSYGIGSGDSQSISLTIKINNFRMDGGYIYILKIESTPNRVNVKIVELRKI